MSKIGQVLSRLARFARFPSDPDDRGSITKWGCESHVHADVRDVLFQGLPQGFEE